MKKFDLYNKIYLSILSVVSFFILFYSFKENNIDNISVYLFSFLLIFIILLLTFYFIIINHISFYPINVLFNLYILITILFFLYNFDDIFNNIYPGLFNKLDKNIFLDLFYDSLKILILTVLFFNAGFFLTLKLFGKVQYNFLPKLNEIEFIRLNFFLLLAKLLFIISYIVIGKGFFELQKPISLLIVLISFYSLIFFEKNKLLNLFIIFFIFFENSVMTLSVYKNMILLIVLFIITYNLKKKISIFIIILLLAWVNFGQAYKNSIRWYLTSPQNQKYLEHLNLSDEVLKMFRELYLKDSPGLIGDTAIEKIVKNYQQRPLILRLSEPVVSLIRILEFQKIKKKEIKKDTLSILKYSMIPRFLFKNKPKQDFAAWYTDHFFNIYDEPGFSPSIVTYNIFWTSDFYINFKYLGSTILSFVIGVFLSIILILITNYKTNNINYLFGVSIMSGITLPDYNFSLMFSPLFLQFVFILLMLKIIMKVIGK